MNDQLAAAPRTESFEIFVLASFGLKRLKVCDYVVDMLLARWVANRIELLKTRSPDRHVFRSVRSQASAELQHGTNIAGRILVFVAPGQRG